MAGGTGWKTAFLSGHPAAAARCLLLLGSRPDRAGTEEEEGAVDRDEAGPASDDWSATPGCTGMQGH